MTAVCKQIKLDIARYSKLIATDVYYAFDQWNYYVRGTKAIFCVVLDEYVIKPQVWRYFGSDIIAAQNVLDLLTQYGRR